MFDPATSSRPTARRPLKVGVFLPVAESMLNGETPRWTDLQAMARQSEAVGFDSLWVMDHVLMPGPDLWGVGLLVAAGRARRGDATRGDRSPRVVRRFPESGPPSQDRRHRRRDPATLEPTAVVQEVFRILFAHYFVHKAMGEAAIRVAVDPDRVSFIGALRLIRDTLPKQNAVAILEERSRTMPGEWLRRSKIWNSRIPELEYDNLAAESPT